MCNVGKGGNEFCYYSLFALCLMMMKYQIPCGHLSLLDSTGSLEVRLVNSKDECSGRAEVRHGDVWYTVCDADWTLSKAQVFCDQLECGNALSAPGAAHFGQGSGEVVEASDTCFSNVTSLRQCSAKGFQKARCGHDHDAGVFCAGNTFLTLGQSLTCCQRNKYLFIQLISYNTLQCCQKLDGTPVVSAWLNCLFD